jgi:hypothetical protein
MAASWDRGRLERSDKASLVRFLVLVMTVTRCTDEKREMHDEMGQTTCAWVMKW